MRKTNIYMVAFSLLLFEALSSDTLLTIKKRFYWLCGGGVGYYFHDNPEFVGHRGSVVIDNIINYGIGMIDFRYSLSPSKHFGIIHDGYLSLGLSTKLYKTFVFQVYAGINLIGKSSRDSIKEIEVFDFVNGVWQLNKMNYVISYSNYLNGINPGIKLFYHKNRWYYGMEVQLYHYHFQSNRWDYPYRYALNGPPFSGKNIYIGINILFNLIEYQIKLKRKYEI